ncbi:Ctr copper transporter [Phaeosphaeria sp. MPI-PUGE-AT-0046c]|nr:Ctr copper transporter [Phaeosphaeria sp. MPI-PUGE-AT-0046c]
MDPMHSMNAMAGMSSTFSSSTRVTLWFTTWTTTTPATYFLTIVFLFLLGILNRFLGALKSQLEKKWQAQRSANSDAPHIGSVEKSYDGGARGHTRQWSRALRQQRVRLEEVDGQENEPLSPAMQPQHAEEGASTGSPPKTPTFWVANAPWSIKKDGTSASLEFVRALIGYVLMLAVMTYNIGFLFAVTGSVLLGEMMFGRYTRGSASIAEDGCHS